MKIPESVIKKLGELERRKRDNKNAARRAKRRDKKIADALNKIRQERAPELIEAAQVVAKWVGDLYSSDAGKRLVKMAGAITIFCQPYWNGMPAFEAELTTFATVSLDAKGNFIYGERYKWMPVHQTYLDINPINPTVLIEALHPDYLTDLAEHLASGAVWEYIENRLSM